ncbi:class I SAM-dependent methyltransferase [Vagococcus elongatus]|uniref:16S rRNA (Cytosine(1402)-N(4))-methyltransferase n=1 Tax=Vagococcus elongatus TaxID=180344 RepID=A0A430AYF9_9ENTE|nr:class I SAM-dependent methyltransferase [Vagococcus elongatus]RSU13078.1 16S rRNA (cytosine(1402)-N(4))-methyltransferase [Vagococcus elongatus]
MLVSALKFGHQLLAEVIVSGDTVVDATVGNGYDTLFLAKLVGKQGKVIGFDIQPQAIEITKQKLLEQHLSCQTRLYLKGHEKIQDVLTNEERIKGAVFNLGYLPKGDKQIITQGKTTITALSTLMDHLEKGGRIVMVIYYGHPGGEQEKETVLDFVKAIPQEEFNVLNYQFINQKNSPPILICIEKKLRKNNP